MGVSSHRPAEMTWMVVEDDYAIRDIINTMCEIWQFDVISFKDGFQATAYLDQDEPGEVLPDVALLDIRVPGPWGHEISARIRQHPRLRNIGVILMTAYELPGSDVEEYLRTSGADWILYKPLPSMDDLLHLARQVVEKRRAMEDR